MEQTTKTRLAAIAGIVVLLASFAAFRDQILLITWKYFWGPVVADAANTATATYRGVTAQRGYNPYNTVVYAFTAAVSLLGLKRLIDRFGIGDRPRFIYGFTPLVVFGGLLRVVEDTGALTYPFNVMIISPVLYGVIVVTALILLAVSLRIGGEDEYWRYLAGGGAALTLLPLAFLTWFGATEGIVPETPFIIGLPAAAILASVGIQQILKQYASSTFLNSPVGSLAIGGHVLDGAATAYSIEALGYSEKHVIARFIIQQSGTAYAFLLIKAVFILGVLSLVEKEEDRFTMLVLLAIVALGIGIGTRNTVRAILGV